jgi:hypothetical protein
MPPYGLNHYYALLPFFFDEEIGAEIVDLEALEGCEIMKNF